MNALRKGMQQRTKVNNSQISHWFTMHTYCINKYCTVYAHISKNINTNYSKATEFKILLELTQQPL